MKIFILILHAFRDLLVRYLPNLKEKENSFAFLVHPRNLEDFFRKFPYLRFLPKSIIYFLTRNLPPIIVSKITGLISKNGDPIKGYIIAITMTARQMMEDRNSALKQIVKAVKFARRKGVGVIGFGALTASFSKGGLDLVDVVNDIGITTGRAYTVKIVTDYAKKVIHDFGFDITTIKVAIVGAGGSIGFGSAQVLVEYGVKNFLFVDLEKRAEHLKEKIKHLKNKNNKIVVEISHAISNIKGYDIIIAATNSPEVIIKPDDLSSGAIIINDAQPSDISPEVLDRDDVLVIEGGVIYTPGIQCNFNLGLADKEDTFCCLGEVLILAHNFHFKSFALGELNLELIKEIEDMASTMNIQLARFQNNKGYINSQQMNYIKNIINKRK